jgi:hypothetical protein
MGDCGKRHGRCGESNGRFSRVTTDSTGAGGGGNAEVQLAGGKAQGTRVKHSQESHGGGNGDGTSKTQVAVDSEVRVISDWRKRHGARGGEALPAVSRNSTGRRWRWTGRGWRWTAR